MLVKQVDAVLPWVNDWLQVDVYWCNFATSTFPLQGWMFWDEHVMKLLFARWNFHLLILDLHLCLGWPKKTCIWKDQTTRIDFLKQEVSALHGLNLGCLQKVCWCLQVASKKQQKNFVSPLMLKIPLFFDDYASPWIAVILLFFKRC